MRGIAVAAVLACLATKTQAQDVNGTWQGLGLWGGKTQTQRAIQITRKAKGGLEGRYYDLGDPQHPETAEPNGEIISSVTLRNRHVHFDLDRLQGSFDGSLSPDGKSLTGRWSGFDPPQPITFTRATPKTAWTIDASPHKQTFVTVAQGVRLEVLDWGGKGPPLLFLSGWGNTAHVFDSFAPRFTGKHHVYAVTRRGFGISSAPPPTVENYDSDRLADDVLAAIDALKLDRPVLAGHSVAGQEMSSIGTRHPEKVSGLVYLEAAFSNAFYNPKGGYTAQVEIDSMRRKLELLPRGNSERADEIKDVLNDLPRLKVALERDLALVEGSAPQPPAARVTLQDRIADVMARSRHTYTGIKPPLLLLIAQPVKCDSDCDSPAEKAWQRERVIQSDAVQADYPKARILRLPNADHYVFQSNAAEVEQQMNDFMDGLGH
jgi:non-heme chloroperoxidase